MILAQGDTFEKWVGNEGYFWFAFFEFLKSQSFIHINKITGGGKERKISWKQTSLEKNRDVWAL